MKDIKKIIVLSFVLLFGINSVAQVRDARQRGAQTIVQDALAQLPAETSDDLAVQMKDIAAAAPESAEFLAGMLADSGNGLESKVQYAVDGLVKYAGTPDGAQYRQAVCEGIMAAADRCQDSVDKAFLVSELAIIAGDAQIPFFTELASDPQFASLAVGALTGIDGSDDAIMGMIETDVCSHPLLAYAAGEKALSQAEPYIISWLGALDGDEETDSDATSPADTPDYRTYCHALALCGTASSARILEKASLKDYMLLLERLALQGDAKTALSGARKYVRKGDADIRSAALGVMVLADPAAASKAILASLKDSDREYRCAALNYAAAYAEDEASCAKVAEAFDRLDNDAKTDVLNWAGTCGVQPMTGIVVASIPVPGSETTLSDDAVVAAIEAAGRLGGDTAADALALQLSGKPEFAEAAFKALLSFDGDIETQIVAALDRGGRSASYALDLASVRRMAELSGKVFELLGSDDRDLAASAFRALPGVVTADDVDRVSGLLDTADDPVEVSMLQNALCSALSDLSGDERFNVVSRRMDKAADPVRYYPAVSFSGSPEAVSLLEKEYSSHPDEAFAALLEVDNLAAADVLYGIAAGDASRKDAALDRYVDLVAEYEASPVSKVKKLGMVMSMEPSDAVKNKFLGVLAETPVLSSFVLASEYLDDPATAYAAAGAVKSIFSKTGDEIDYDLLKRSLEKAREIYRATPGADNGYAVDEIDKMISGLQPPAPIFVLPADEAEQGFEVLFDGTDMSHWTGNLEAYSLINHTIYVTADYGAAGNLYTKDEYRDFILRFEFCFERPGVNNGVGIRTPQGVDAAYWGLCECQILDHDDPIYKDLNPYQVHGSAYGIIPAKRVVHKPLGTWNKEEIKVVGYHITVTLNGEVILDGDIREACQGHNVAPDGGTYNPYTVDHRNHPGMFNEKGYISFCGHGPGIRFRNIRILDLSK